jgi:tetraacyldisaccharide 4'-kinase
MTIIEGLYYIGYSIKKQQALKHQKKLPCRVFSIGNLTVGGTGKTPATIAVAEEAKKRGLMPCVLTRGYKGSLQGPCFVSKGDKPLLNEEEAGDEPILMAERLKGVPVIKGADRYEAGKFALCSLPAALRPDVFILDDGFQHWKLFRDKDVLLIDGTNPFGNRRLLPLGPLREPLNAIARADIIVITKADKSVRSQESRVPPTQPSPSRGEGKGGGERRQQSIDSLIEEIKKHNSKAPLFFAEHRPSKFITATGDVFPLEWARGKNFFGFSGIGNSASFKETLLTAGLQVKGFKSYRDHYRYNAGDMRKIIEDSKKSDANWIVTTEKDIMRLRRLNMPANIVALTIEFRVDEGFYEEVFTK